MDVVEDVIKSFGDKKLADEEAGAEIIKLVLTEPLRQIASNAGAEGSVVVEEVKKRQGSVGYNAAKDKYEDLEKAGVVDPVKVTRSALQNAGSVAGMLLTTEAVITEIPEKTPPLPHEAAGAGPMGGMGGF